MGNEAAEHDGAAYELEPGMPGLEEAASGIANRHALPASPALERLVDVLFGLSCRDQELGWSDPTAMAERRREGYAIANRMKKTAAGMISSLEALYADMGRFGEVVRYNPGLLETIFDVDTGGPGQLSLPPELMILQTCFRSASDDDVEVFREDWAETTAADVDDGPLPIVPVPFAPCEAGFWEEADERLAAVASLPVRSDLPRGPVPNTVLRDALRRLREYWKASSGRSWGMSSLRHREVRKDNEVDNLIGPCERFVVDVLHIAGIRFSFFELASTWTAVDRSPTGSARPETRR